MKLIQRLRERADSLKHEIIAIYYAYKHPETPRLPKVIILITIAYAASPVDLIPDFIPILGYLDDLIIIPALIALSIRLIPRTVMIEAREKAKREPIQLKKNTAAAAIFITLWIILIAAVTISVIRFIAG